MSAEAGPTPAARVAPTALTTQSGQRTLVMGVVNATPDSFSDGGRWSDAGSAIAHGRILAAQGAAIVDVGGESTRPGASRPDEAEELRRTIPVVAGLADAGVVCSIDTMRSRVAAAALQAGARIVNDVSGGLADPQMAGVVAAAGADYILMHWRGHSVDMQQRARYGDVVAEVRGELLARVDAVRTAGVAADRIVLDPGLGFAKDAGHNWALLARLDDLAGLGYPLLVGASRKHFLGALEPDEQGRPSPPTRRDAATAATSLLAAQAGARCVRVHDVAATVSALRVLAAVDAVS